jgi:putative glycosyltransferase (TIGR04348 family)
VKTQLITPAPPGSQRGNRITASRWAAILESLGHGVEMLEDYDPARPAELLVALHAKKSHRAIVRFRRDHPERPLILAMTGTDLYADILTDEDARASLELATRIIVLQTLGVGALPAHVRERARTIHQSVSPPAEKLRLFPERFTACVLGHLRAVKDPFLAAAAARLVKEDSRLSILQLGAALSPEMEAEAKRETAINPRYHWAGEVERGRALSILAGSDVLVLTSTLEGGANAVSEAIACEVPVLSTAIDGSIGLLGADYPGYFPVKNPRALADLLERTEHDGTFRERLRASVAARKSLIDPEREREAWAELLGELAR